MSKLVNRLYDLVAGQSDSHFDYHSGSGYGGYSDPGYSHSGSYSSGYGDDCCPLVVDPLTYSALLGFIALATYFFERLIAMSMLMKKRRKREINIIIEKGKQSKKSYFISKNISFWFLTLFHLQ